MKLYFAPMEGITGYVYRNAYHQHFGSIDKYFTPFITPNQTHKLTSRELNDILPDHNQGMQVVPQIMSNKAEDFIWAAKKLQQLGYHEVNLNLGCPSGTVVSKGRGSGFLSYPYKLQMFLEEVCQALETAHMGFSIKTRIGRFEADEFPGLLKIFNQYPLAELIIHPRVQTDYYKNTPNLEVFEEAVERSKNPICYNGDIFSKEQYEVFIKKFPQIEMVMLGRGIIAHPGLAKEIQEGTMLSKEKLKAFHDTVCFGYQGVISGDRNVLYKMKELWQYMGENFVDHEKCLKKIRKATTMEEYRAAVTTLIEEKQLREKTGFPGWGRL